MSPSPLGLSAHIFKTEEMGLPTMQDDVLMSIHPGRRVDVFREPMRAGELMRKYPRHCIARPDVFEHPWIAVHPQSLLPTGKVFFVVPYHTVHLLLKGGRQQQQQQQRLASSKHKQPPKLFFHCLSHNIHNSRINSDHRNVNDEEYFCGDSGTGSLYKLIRRVRRVTRRNQYPNRPQESFHHQLDSPVESRRRPRVTSPEQIELLRVKPCVRKPDSVRKKLNLRVTFASPLVITSNREG